MITLRCTQKLRQHLRISPVTQPVPPTATLGDWYANLIPTVAGDLIIFVSERSLLTVALPVGDATPILVLFRLRVTNLLAGIGISPQIIKQELAQYEEIQFGKTASRSLLGSMNDFAWHYQIYAEEARTPEDLSLSYVEFRLSQMPCSPLEYQFPANVAEELLN